MLRAQQTAESRFGDIAFPLFRFAKACACAPAELSARIAEGLADIDPRWGRAATAGGYINIYLNRARVINDFFERGVGDAGAASLVQEAESGALHKSESQDGTRQDDKEQIGASQESAPQQSMLQESAPQDRARQGDAPQSDALVLLYAGQNICIEYSSPNTNKPLHLGHLRNNVLGESIARILSRCGATVVRVNLINDRGIHICKSMAAYQRFGAGSTPQSEQKKPDLFVGDYYVAFDRWQREDARALEEAQQMLVKWEQGDAETRELWQQMRAWALTGIAETYRRTDIHFDALQYESDTYLFGKEIVEQGLARAIFRKAHDGAIEIDLSDIGLDTKTLLRADGTSIYITQDLGTAALRHRRWHFDRMIYVVANEQEYHFQVLFEIMKRLQFPFASRLFHRSYGMVKLPDGRMKSREGNVVDADALIDEVHDAVRREMNAESAYLREASGAEQRELAEKIAISSIHYWLLRADPLKDITFDTNQSISFTGNSGAYILYTITRMHHLRTHARHSAEASDQEASRAPGELLSHELEWQLIFLIAQYEEVIAEAAHNYTPFPIASYLYRLAQLFSRYYHDVPIAKERRPEYRAVRLALIAHLLSLFEHCCHLLVMPIVTDM